MKTDPLISVIVPVYNVAEYLSACVESVQRQSYAHWELLLVDDGSTDGSGPLCDELSAGDPRIRVIHKENGGASSARKVGIGHGKGAYFMLLDADDWLDPETLSACLDRAIADQSDCVMFPYVREYANGSYPVYFFPEDRLFINEEARDKIHCRLFGLRGEELAVPTQADSFTSTCMKLFSASCIRQARYFDTKEVSSGEVILFNIHALQGARRISYINRPYYHYRRGNTASLSTAYRPLLQEKWQNLYSCMLSAIEEYGLGEEYREALDNRMALSIIGLGFVEIQNPNRSQQLRNIRSFLSDAQYRRAVKKLPLRFLPPIWKVFFVLCRLRFSLCVYLCLKLAFRLKEKF